MRLMCWATLLVAAPDWTPVVAVLPVPVAGLPVAVAVAAPGRSTVPGGDHNHVVAGGTDSADGADVSIHDHVVRLPCGPAKGTAAPGSAGKCNPPA